MQITRRRLLGVTLTTIILSVILTSSFFTAFAPAATTTLFVEGGIYPSSPSYTLWRESSTYYSKDIYGQSNSSSNFTSFFSWIMNSLPTYGGIIHLKTGYYIGSITINRDGVILEGEGSYNDVPTGIPDNSPTLLYGSVIRITRANYNAITITGQRYGVVIRDLGIWFNVSSTGNGIAATNTNYSITHSTIENIKVLNCDKDSYAIRMDNFLHCNIKSVMAWGGPALELHADTDSFHSGNSIVDNVYNYIKYDLAPVTLSGGPYPIFIHKNDSNSDNYVNLMSLRRIQVNNPTTQTDADYFSFVAFNLRYSTISNLNLEGVNNNTVKLGSTFHVTFDTAYVWTLDPGDADINIAADNSYVTWINSELENILDSNWTDRYINCKITGNIDSDSLASFDGLEGNEGVTTFTGGQTSVTISATWIGTNSLISIIILDDAALTSGESLKIESIDTANNQFVVNCIDEGALSQTISIHWRVEGNYES